MCRKKIQLLCGGDCIKHLISPTVGRSKEHMPWLSKLVIFNALLQGFVFCLWSWPLLVNPFYPTPLEKFAQQAWIRRLSANVSSFCCRTIPFEGLRLFPECTNPEYSYPTRRFPERTYPDFLLIIIIGTNTPRTRKIRDIPFGSGNSWMSFSRI